MSLHNSPRLAELAAANSQRSALRQLFEQVSPGLRAFLKSSESIVHPGTPPLLLAALSTACEVHSGKRSPGDHEVFETSSLEVSYAWLSSRLARLPESTCFLSFGPLGTFAYQSQWVPKLPVFRASKAALASVFVEILDLSQGNLAIVQQGGQASLVLGNYLGVLPNAPSPDEMVYELTFHPSDG